MIHLGREERPEGAVAVSAEGEYAGDEKLGRFGSDGRKPLHEEEFVHPERLPAFDESAGKRLGGEQHQEGRREEERGDRDPPPFAWQVPELLRHPDQLGLVLLSAGGDPQIGYEQREQHCGVVPGEPAREGDDERIEAGRTEKEELGPTASSELHAAGPFAAFPETPGEEERHERPADPEEEAVAPGHVRRGVVAVLRNLAGGEGEVEIDCVLGQHGDHRQDGRGEAARDVVVGGLPRPDEQEGGGHHRAAENGDGERRWNRHAGKAQEDRGERGRDGEGDLPPSRHSRCIAASRSIARREIPGPERPAAPLSTFPSRGPWHGACMSSG